MLEKRSVLFGSDFYCLAFRVNPEGNIVIASKFFKLPVNTSDIHEI